MSEICFYCNKKIESTEHRYQIGNMFIICDDCFCFTQELLGNSDAPGVEIIYEHDAPNGKRRCHK